MSAKPRPDTTSTETPSSDPLQDLQRVREILFGAQQRSTEQQLAELEQRLTGRIDALRRELIAAIGSESSAAAQRLQAAIGELGAGVRAEQAALATRLHEQLQHLQTGKLDRDAMADLLTGLAVRLGKQAGA
ncbi:MAG: hypothetical protein MUC36_17320 [Planctomycetes bacterium]|jgi:hypothetical protein|nr:hypothetical protein [Planctomycetota bacterium]